MCGISLEQRKRFCAPGQYRYSRPLDSIQVCFRVEGEIPRQLVTIVRSIDPTGDGTFDRPSCKLREADRNPNLHCSRSSDLIARNVVLFFVQQHGLDGCRGGRWPRRGSTNFGRLDSWMTTGVLVAWMTPASVCSALPTLYEAKS